MKHKEEKASLKGKEEKLLDFFDFRIGIVTIFIASSVFFGFLYQHIILDDRFGAQVVGVYGLRENFWHWFLLGIPTAIFFVSVFAILQKSGKGFSDAPSGDAESAGPHSYIDFIGFLLAISLLLLVNLLFIASVIASITRSSLLMFFLTGLYAAGAPAVSVSDRPFLVLFQEHGRNLNNSIILHIRRIRPAWLGVVAFTFLASLFAGAFYIIYELYLYYNLLDTIKKLISDYLDTYLITLSLFSIAIIFYFRRPSSILRSTYIAFSTGVVIISVIALNLFSTLILPPSLGGFANFALRVHYQLINDSLSKSSILSESGNEYTAILILQNQGGLVLETSRCGQQLTEAKQEEKLTNFQVRCLLYVPRENVKYVQTIPKITPRSQSGKH